MLYFLRTYHYVPPCPKCGSKKTGRYIYVLNTININKLIADNLKCGELTKPVVGFGDDIEVNAYCEECDTQWFAKIEEFPLSKKIIEKESKDRGITLQNCNDMKN